MQISYNSGTLTEMLANANRMVALSANVYKDKELEIQRVPLLNMLYDRQVKAKQNREAATTMEKLIEIYKRAIQGAPEASPPSGVPSEKPRLRADPNLVEYLSILTSLYLDIGENTLALKAFCEVEELLPLFKPP
jgi:hypothetical protein